MRLYLVQHGEAKPETEDPQRPLAEVGQQAVERVARHAAHAGVRPQVIFHSGKLRAQQTAEVLAGHLQPERGPEMQSGLNPNDDLTLAAELARDATDDLMLVGHLPHLSRLASLLLVNNADAQPVRFQMGGIVCLERDTPGSRWLLRWMLTPEISL